MSMSFCCKNERFCENVYNELDLNIRQPQTFTGAHDQCYCSYLEILLYLTQLESI